MIGQSKLLSRPSAAELRSMPIPERERILAEQADLADPVYRRDPTLTDFEAFGEEVDEVEQPPAEAR